MTITSSGYAGTVNDAQWARLAPLAGGAFYTAEAFNAMRVTVAAGTRTVQVSAGSPLGVAGYGIRDVNDAVITKTLDSVPSGTRWDMIVLRRNWATKATTVEVVQGGSVKALPSRNTNPGTLDDQPLALVRVAAGSTSIQEIVDLRVFIQNGGAIALDDLVRSYLTQPGTSLRIGDTVWTRTFDAAGSAVWASDAVEDTGWVSVPRGANWAAVSGYALQARRVGRIVTLRGAVRANASASFASLAIIPVGMRPLSNTPLGATVTSSKAYGELFLQPNGNVFIDSEYRVGSGPVGTVVMLHGAWCLD